MDCNKLVGYARRSSIASTCALFVSVGTTGSVQAAPPVDQIANGDFETGDFTGWTIVDTGSGGSAINDGTFIPTAFSALPPITGTFDAVTFQNGPGFHALRQMFLVPDNVFSANLTWNDRIRSAAPLSDPNQEWRVQILDVFDNVLLEVFSTTPGDPQIQEGPNSRSGDLTAVLQAHASEILTVSFEEQDNVNFFSAALDDVQLLVATLPVGKNECKKGGWSTFVNVNSGEQIFKNQGDCVSFVSTQGRNPPANY